MSISGKLKPSVAFVKAVYNVWYYNINGIKDEVVKLLDDSKNDHVPDHFTCCNEAVSSTIKKCPQSSTTVEFQQSLPCDVQTSDVDLQIQAEITMNTSELELFSQKIDNGKHTITLPGLQEHDMVIVKQPVNESLKCTTTYCICKSIYDNSRNMIMCNYCGEWFHEECIGISLASLKKNEYYM